MAVFSPRLDYDILYYIISHLEPEKGAIWANSFEDREDIPLDQSGGHKADFSDIISMAKTCRAFSTPCLQALWRTQTSLIPVLKLIPQFKSSGPRNSWILGRDIAPSDWNRFDHYASMVQEINLRRADKLVGGDTENVHDSVFCYLYYSRNGFFFPNLTTLSAGPDIRMPLFHSPVLSRVELRRESTLAAADPWASSFIDRLHMSPYLNTVALKDILVGPTTLRILFNTPQLQSLEICVAPSFFLTDLTTLIDTSSVPPNLQVLKIGCLQESRNVTPISPAPAPSRRLAIPNLQSLSFCGPIDDMTVLCETIECQDLRHCFFSVVHARRISLSMQGSLHERIALQLELLSSGNLESLTILLGNEYMVPFKPMRTSHFLPLYNLRNLKKLELNNLPFIPTDSDLALMGQSYPLLETLTIPLSLYVDKPKATLRGLKSLVELCPHLEEISLTLDVTLPSSIPDPEDQKRVLDHEHPPASLQLLTLDVNHSALHLECVEPAATLIKSLFPNLKNLRFDDNGDYDSDDGMPPVFGSFGREESLWTKVRERLMG